MEELYKAYRPQQLKHVVGLDSICTTLRKMVKAKKVPHSILLTGPSGCGKTTIARILKNLLECGNMDFQELNCADVRGIDAIRNIRREMTLHPISGANRIYLFDEAHQFSTDAQNALLKMLEDTPSYVYFILASTHPQKIIEPIKTRCTTFAVNSLTSAQMTEVLERVIKAERLKVGEEVLEKIVSISEGSPRRGLVLLDSIRLVEDEEEQLAVLKKADAKQAGIAIARALFDQRTRWGDMAKILRECPDDPESIRWIVLGYASKIMLGGGKLTVRASRVIDAFRDNFFDTKQAGLIQACYECLST